jgi:hypothetical protein
MMREPGFLRNSGTVRRPKSASILPRPGTFSLRVLDVISPAVRSVSEAPPSADIAGRRVRSKAKRTIRA